MYDQIIMIEPFRTIAIINTLKPKSEAKILKILSKYLEMHYAYGHFLLTQEVCHKHLLI